MNAARVRQLLTELGTSLVDATRVVGDDELEAAVHAFCCDLEVFKHGARDQGHRGEFIRQGYNVQIEHLEEHLRRRGKPDPDSGLDGLKHTHGRCTLALALQDGIVGPEPRA